MKFNFNSIKKVCINLEHPGTYNQRRDLMCKQFMKHHIEDVEFIPGYDATIKPLPDLLQKPAGVYGCMMAHYNAVKMAKELKLPAICIFEDDIVFCDDFHERIAYLESLEDFDFDVLSLGGHWADKYVGYTAQPTKWKHIYRSIDHGGTYAYIVTEKVYDFILGNLNYIYGIDEFYGNFLYRRFHSYAMTPFLVGTMPNVSEVTGNFSDYENVKWFYRQQPFDLNSAPVLFQNAKSAKSASSADKETWEKAQLEEAKQYGFADFQTGFDHYGKAYKQYFEHLGINADLKGKKILEIGPAVYPALAYCTNIGESYIIEPIKSATLERCIQGKPITLITQPAEELDKYPQVDEVWLFNVLTHTIDPYAIINTAKKYAEVIRFFEPINQLLDVMHLHKFTLDDFKKTFGPQVKHYPKNGTAVAFHQHECAYGVWEQLDGRIADLKDKIEKKEKKITIWRSNPGGNIYPLKNVTFIIPVRIESFDREFNFLQVIQYLCDNFETNIIIYESDIERKVEDLIYRNIDLKRNQITTISEINPDPIFHRTRLLNVMLNQVKTPVVVNYDIDIFMKPEAYIEAANAIIDGGYDLVYPYAKGEGENEFGKAQYSVHIPDKHNYNGESLFNEKWFKQYSTLCGHLQFFNTNSYIAGGMENEEFISYGAEDVERMIRFQKLGYKVMWLNNYVYHIDHSRGVNSIPQNPHFAANEMLYKETLNMTPEQLIEKYKNISYLQKYLNKKEIYKNEFCLLTYADKNYAHLQKRLVEQAKTANCFDRIFNTDRDMLERTDFYKQFRHILDHPRGSGYWLWKPFYILETLKQLKDGDVLMYMDAGDCLQNTEEMKEFIFNKMQDEKLDMLLTNGAYPNGEWTKEDCFILMQATTPEYRKVTQLEAGILVFKKTEDTMSFLNEWLFYCQNINILTDQAVVHKNGDNFKDHRHDQSILTNLKVFHKIPSGSDMRRFVVCNVECTNNE